MLATSQEPAPIRVTTRLVEVTVLVRDSGGRAVTGLGREDFHLLEGGQLECIRTFAAFDSAHTPQAPAGRFAQRTPGEGPHAVTVILFDQFDSRFEQQADSRDVLLRFFREVEPRQPIAVVSLAGDVRVLHDFTTDAPSLVHTLEKYRPSRPLISATFTPTTSRGPGFGKIDRMALRRSYEDSHATYGLGYYPSHDMWDGQFRRTQVTVGRPDVQVRHRAGYRAVPDYADRH